MNHDNNNIKVRVPRILSGLIQSRTKITRRNPTRGDFELNRR